MVIKKIIRIFVKQKLIMIDWTIQRTIKNYCGFCDGSPSSPMCSGECFKGHEKSSCNNRVDHVITMLKQIPEEIERLKKLEKDFMETLTCNLPKEIEKVTI